MQKAQPIRLSFYERGLVTDFRTFYNDYLMVVKFYEWLKEKAEGLNRLPCKAQFSHYRSRHSQCRRIDTNFILPLPANAKIRFHPKKSHLLKLLRASYTISPRLTSFKENQVPIWEIDT